MFDLKGEFGARVLERLNGERVIWLATVDKAGAPQPRPVWFLWDGTSVLIFSQPKAAKVRHILRNPSVSLNFNSDEYGSDVVVILGRAEVREEGVSKSEIEAYVAKYDQDIKSLGMDRAQFEQEYSKALRVTPTGVRGFE